MSENGHGRGVLSNPFATGEEIRRAMEVAIFRALRDHKRAGNPIAVWDWEKNEVVIIPPEEIVVPDEDEVRDEAVETRTTREG